MIMSLAGKPMAVLTNVACHYGRSDISARSVKAGIAAFLDGKSDGGELLHALYDHVLFEPMPSAMRAILKGPPSAAD
jgi:hypothetical protein